MRFSRPLTAAAVALVLGTATVLAWRVFNDAPRAPDVTYTRLDGSTGHVGELRGQVTLVNFWATSCETCMHEMPQMVATQKAYQDRGLQFLAVAMSYDQPEFVAKYAQSRQLPFQVTFDRSGEIAQRFGEVRLTPTTYVLNKRGEIVKRYVGEPDFKALHALIEQLLAESA